MNEQNRGRPTALTPKNKNHRTMQGSIASRWSDLLPPLPPTSGNNDQQEYSPDAVNQLKSEDVLLDVEDYQEILGTTGKELATAYEIQAKPVMVDCGVTPIDPGITIDDTVQLQPDDLLNRNPSAGKYAIQSRGSRLTGSLTVARSVRNVTVLHSW